MKFITINADFNEVKKSYRFVFDGVQRTGVDPDYKRRIGENRMYDMIDSLYDGYVELCRCEEDGELYGVYRDYGMNNTNGEYPVVIWHRMVAR